MFNGHRVSVWEDENVLDMDGSEVTQQWEYTYAIYCTLKNG